MDKAFFEASKKIANDFLQSIVFIDDQAFSNAALDDHSFDALRISKTFAEAQKICAVYQPKTISDINNLIELTKKADVSVIDWKMNIEEVVEEEENYEEEDTRGKFSRKIIKGILNDPLTGKNSLKLIIIYTGETDLRGITDTISKDLNSSGFEGFTLSENQTEIATPNFVIQVRGKSNSESADSPDRFIHNPELNNLIINYEALPDYILEEYTRLTSGLLSNFILKSLTILRQNTFSLINQFNNNLDRALLLHHVLLPKDGDIEELLVGMMADSVYALLHYNKAAEVLSPSSIEAWIAENSFSRKETIVKKEIKIDKEFVLDCFQNGFVQAVKSKWPSTPSNNELEKIKRAYKNLNVEHPKIFFLDQNSSSNELFSILSHHKSNLKQPSMVPRLSLGTIIKEKEGTRYFLCIQARCDSVRIENERKFIFLELLPVEGKKRFHIVVERNSEFIRLYIAKSAYELRTIKFKADPENQSVVAIKDGGDYIFSSIYEEKNKNETFIWLADLKDAHAQRAANNFAAKVSRVGLDESEWLRRWATD